MQHYPHDFPVDRQPDELISIGSSAQSARTQGDRVPAALRHRSRWCEIASKNRLSYFLVTGTTASKQVFYDNGGTVVERFLLPPDTRVGITTTGNQNAGHVAYWYAIEG